VAQYERARAVFRRSGRQREEVATLLGLSETYSWFHKPELVLRSVNDALAIALETGDRGAQAACLVMRGEGVAIVDGPVPAAIRDSTEAVRLARETPDTRLLARTLTYAGRHLEWHSDYERAIGYLQEGAELARHEHAGTLMGLGLYHLGHARLARADYQEALRVYRDLGAYADAAGDKLYIARVPNLLGGVYLDLYDLDEALRWNAEGDDVSRRLWPWPEPRGHSLWKLGVAHLYRGDHARAQAALREAWDLLEVDIWGRWLWYISLLRSLGELALAEGRRDEAWDYATRSLEMATRCGQRKHAARAQRLQGEILAAQDRLGEAQGALEASIALAERLGTPREVWLGRAALARVAYRVGRDREAEANAGRALATLEVIAGGLTTPSLRLSFLGAEPVLDVYRILGRRPPAA
jgi:tetratricopeptide (TPR) repeat protein